MTLATSEYWDKVLINAVTEFLAFSGVKIAFYSSLVIGGLGLVFSPIRKVGVPATWLSSNIAQFGFNISSIAVGVIVGLGVPSVFQGGFAKVVYLLLFFVLLTIIFTFIGKIPTEEWRQQVSEKTKIPQFWVSGSVGFVLILFGLHGFQKESFPEVFNPQVECECEKP